LRVFEDFLRCAPGGNGPAERAGVAHGEVVCDSSIDDAGVAAQQDAWKSRTGNAQTDWSFMVFLISVLLLAEWFNNQENSP
jgi:hypothetical protein